MGKVTLSTRSLELQTKTIMLMKKLEFYVSPDIRLIKVEPEGILCGSTDTATVNNPFDGLTEDEW